jgi:hypothetical protein
MIYIFIFIISPGRHYKYISKYTLFLIDLAKVTGDTQTLKYLCRKLRRAQTTVLNDKLVYKQACAAYFEVRILFIEKKNNHLNFYYY